MLDSFLPALTFGWFWGGGGMGGVRFVNGKERGKATAKCAWGHQHSTYRRCAAVLLLSLCFRMRTALRALWCFFLNRFQAVYINYVSIKFFQNEWSFVTNPQPTAKQTISTRILYTRDSNKQGQNDVYFGLFFNRREKARMNRLVSRKFWREEV